MLDQPYGPQDGCIFSAVTKRHSIYKSILKTKLTTHFYGISSALWHNDGVHPPTAHTECPPAAVPVRSKNNICVGHKELTLDAEDDGVEGCRGQGEEEDFEFKAHAEKNSTCQKWQDTGVNRVLRKKKNRYWLILKQRGTPGTPRHVHFKLA